MFLIVGAGVVGGGRKYDGVVGARPASVILVDTVRVVLHQVSCGIDGHLSPSLPCVRTHTRVGGFFLYLNGLARNERAEAGLVVERWPHDAAQLQWRIVDLTSHFDGASSCMMHAPASCNESCDMQ